MPSVRPRSGTWNSRTPSRAASRAPSRSGTPTASVVYNDSPFDEDGNRVSLALSKPPFANNAEGGLQALGEWRGSKQYVLTPTDEREEELVRHLSRESAGKGKEREV